MTTVYIHIRSCDWWKGTFLMVSDASRYLCLISLAGSPAFPDSNSPADMTTGAMPNFLNARLHWNVFPCPFPPQIPTKTHGWISCSVFYPGITPGMMIIRLSGKRIYMYVVVKASEVAIEKTGIRWLRLCNRYHICPILYILPMNGRKSGRLHLCLPDCAFTYRPAKQNAEQLCDREQRLHAQRERELKGHGLF